MSAPRRAALFLDYDNFAIEFENNTSYVGVALGMFHPQLLVHFVEAEISCEIIQKRAYGEFNICTNRVYREHIYKGTQIRDMIQRDRNQRKSLMVAGFEFAYCPALTSAGKNGADIELCVDVVQLAMARSDIDTFFIASGDSDMIGTCRRLRAHGKYVVLIALRQQDSDRYSDIVSRVLYFDPDAVAKLTIGPLEAAIASLGEKGSIERGTLLSEIQRNGFRPQLAGFDNWDDYLDVCLGHLESDEWIVGGDGRIRSVRHVEDEEQALRDTEDVVEQFLRGWNLRTFRAEERRQFIKALKGHNFDDNPMVLTQLCGEVSAALKISKKRGNGMCWLLLNVGFFVDASGEPIRDFNLTPVCGVLDIEVEQLRLRTTRLLASQFVEKTGVDARLFTDRQHAAIFADKVLDRRENEIITMVVDVFAQMGQHRAEGAADESPSAPPE